MAFNDLTVVVGVTPRLSQARFADILRERGSPAAAGGLAADGWAAVKQHGVDPAFALAIFHQESQFANDAGSATAVYGLRNPGHCRSTRIGVGTPVNAHPWGTFIRYPSWTDGWHDLAFRLVDETYDYAKQGRRAIRRILELWAPPGDVHDVDGLNNTDRYVRNVVHNMTNWVDLPNGGIPIDGGGVSCPLFPPPPFTGNDQQIGTVTFHAEARTVTAAHDGVRCLQFADPASCQTREPLRRGESFDALYWVNGKEIEGESRWWVSKSGSRIWSGGTVQQPGMAG